MMTGDERIRELEMRIAELRLRIPAHSVPPRMLEELEDLEEELERLKADVDELCH